jgi:hypothetical protein
MNTRQRNRLIELWHSGKPISEISKQTGMSEREIGHQLLGATERAVRVWSNCGVPRGTPVRYPECVKR